MCRADQVPSDTIFAPASAAGRAGVSVIRISGEGTRKAFHIMAGGVPDTRRAVLRVLKDHKGDPIDQALCLFFEAPHSFTGEDVGEFHIHGSPAVLNACLAALSACSGFRIAEPGEFARRAFDNGKLDLSEIEGLADLIDAETDHQRRQAFRQLQGGLTREIDRWRDQLIRALAYFDAELDFSDEADVDSAVFEQAKTVLSAVAQEMRAALTKAAWGERIRDGFIILLAGPPNSGKSTLLNSLASREVAIVSDRPGTTRDLIEVRLDLKGYPVTVIDSAGIRESGDEIEREGIRRTLEQAERADLVLWLQSSVEPLSKPSPDFRMKDRPLIEIMTQIDRVKDIAGDELALSAKTGQGIDRLIDHIISLIEKNLDRGTSSAVLTRARHRAAVEEALDFIDRAMSAGQGFGAELIAEDIRLAARAIGKITGNVSVEEILDQLFSSFCIGK